MIQNSFQREKNILIHTRVLNAPLELVWDVWTRPEHIANWYGPEGFSITMREMNVETNGRWEFVMSGFGQDYENHVQYTEVVKHSRLCFHNPGLNEAMSFDVVITFELVENKTVLTMKSIFKSAEVLDELDRMVNAIERGKESLNKMEAYIQQQLSLQN